MNTCMYSYMFCLKSGEIRKYVVVLILRMGNSGLLPSRDREGSTITHTAYGSMCKQLTKARTKHLPG